MSEEPKKRRSATLARRLKNRDHLISGIHNYCERWCEKCSFTARCGVYEMEEDYKKKKPEVANDPSRFAEQMQDIFAETLAMLQEMAEEMGIDLDEVAKNTDYKPKQPKGPLIDISKDYGHKLHNWLKATDEKIREKIIALASVSDEKAGTLSEAVETASWFNFFISVKLSRAMMQIDGEDNEYARQDGLGSAKVAIIATEKSIAALTIILSHLPEEEDTLLDLLAKLEKIRRGSHARFPGAMDFIRPGFDE